MVVVAMEVVEGGHGGEGVGRLAWPCIPSRELSSRSACFARPRPGSVPVSDLRPSITLRLSRGGTQPAAGHPCNAATKNRDNSPVNSPTITHCASIHRVNQQRFLFKVQKNNNLATRSKQRLRPRTKKISDRRSLQ